MEVAERGREYEDRETCGSLQATVAALTPVA